MLFTPMPCVCREHGCTWVYRQDWPTGASITTSCIFADQIDNTGIIPGSVSGAERPVNDRKYMADFGAGFQLYYGSNWMLGGAAQHINQPDESLTSTIYSKLPVRWVGYTRYKWNLDEEGESYFLPSLIYYNQGGSNSLSLGCEYKNARMAIGAWYRGNVDFKNSDAFAVTLSLDLFDWRENTDSRVRIGTSYDATTGQLGFSRSAGSGEAAIIWEQLTPNGVRSDERCDANYSMRGTPCPQRF